MAKKLFEDIQETYNYRENYEKFKPLIFKLHWHFLPIYSDQMINNRDVNPEDDIYDYYNHFHSLQDLYKIFKSVGDFNNHVNEYNSNEKNTVKAEEFITDNIDSSKDSITQINEKFNFNEHYINIILFKN